MAIILINEKEPELASSYHWCTDDEHENGMHTCVCGIWWLGPEEDLVQPTWAMWLWRNGSPEDIAMVSGRMLG